MHILLIICSIVTALLFFAGRKNRQGVCHLLSPVAALLTMIVAITSILSSTDARLASGSDYPYLDAKASHLSKSLTCLASQKKIAGPRILILRPEAPKPGEGLNDDVQHLIDKIRQELPAEWELITKEALEGNAQAVTCNHFDRAIKGERYDILLSFIGLPQDLDNCAESQCFSPGSHEGRLVIVGSGMMDNFARALEMNLFDLALLPSSQAKLKLGGRPLTFAAEQALEFTPAKMPKAEILAENN